MVSIIITKLRGRRNRRFGVFLICVVLVALLTAVLGVATIQERPEWTNGASPHPVVWSGVQTSKGGDIEVPEFSDEALFSVGSDRERDDRTQRAERFAADPEMRVREGIARTFNFNIEVPEKLEESPGAWLIFAQFHQSLSRCPPNLDLRLTSSPFESLPVVSLSIRGGRLESRRCKVQYQRTYRLGNASYGSPLSVSLSAVFSPDRESAITAVCFNNSVSTRVSNVPNLYRGMDAYLKQGIYRPTSNVRSVLRSGPVEFTTSLRCSCGGVRSC